MVNIVSPREVDEKGADDRLTTKGGTAEMWTKFFHVEEKSREITDDI